jgi:hypothetical protein
MPTRTPGPIVIESEAGDTMRGCRAGAAGGKKKGGPSLDRLKV